MTQQNSTMKGARRFAGLTRSLLVVVTMTAMMSIPAIGAFASTNTHAVSAPQITTGSAASQVGHDSVLEPTWGLGFINSAVDEDELVAAMGRPFGASGLYAPLKGWSFPSGSAKQVALDGGLLYFNINSTHIVSGNKVCYSYSDVAAGLDDDLLQVRVDQLASFGYANVILTYNHEPTVSSRTQPSCGTAAEYVAAFHHVHTYFVNHGITYPWAWTMVSSRFVMNDAKDWQPAAADFDVVGVDGYNRFIDGEWKGPEYIFGASDAYAKALGKPLLIGEIGTMEDPADPNRKAEWLTAASNLFDSYGNVMAILWNDSRDFRLDSSTKTLNTWADLSTNDGTPYLSGTTGAPGQTVSVWGTGLTAGETVDVHLDSKAGRVVGSEVANANGVMNDVELSLPTPLAGGDHSLFAVGETSGLFAQSVLDVYPAATASFAIASGATWTYHGAGWVPDELVSVSFPDSAVPASQLADSTGSVDIDLVSPREPNPGGVVTVTAPSYTTYVKYHATRVVTVPSTGVPQQNVTVSGSGFGSYETVNVKFDGKATTQSFTTGRLGMFSGPLHLDLTFGHHQVTLTGATSKVTGNASIILASTMTLSPTSGPTGTTVTIDSGPGWIPGEHVQVKLGSTVLVTFTAGTDGSVHGNIVIDRKQPGTINIHLNGMQSGINALASFTVTAP